MPTTRRTGRFTNVVAVAAAVTVSIVTLVDGRSAPTRSEAQATDGVVRRALDNGGYPEAERLATQLVVTTETEHGPGSLELAAALDLRVEALLKNGKGAAASTLTLAERVVDLKSRLLGQDDLELAISLNNLGALHSERGEYRAAVPLHERALSIRLRALGRDDPATADALDGLVVPLILLNRFGEAQQDLRESERIRESRPDESLALARTLYLVALLHRQDGTYAEAMGPLDRALDIQRRVSPNHPDTARSLRLRGDLLFFGGDLAGAQAMWNEALGLVERTLGPDHPMVPPLLRWLANAKKSLGDIADAQRLLERALSVGQSVLAPCQPESAALLNDTANLAGYNGDYTKARKFFSNALAVVERCYGPTHSLTATVIYNQGALAMDMGDLDQAEILHARAVRVWSAGLGPSHPYVARGLDALAEVVARRGQLTRARSLYEQALSIRERQLGESHPDTAWTLANLARTASSAGRSALALQRVDRAIDIYRRGAASQEPDHFARALALRGDLQARSGDYQAARANYAEALETRERIFGSAHPLTAEARAGLASADFELGSTASALDSALAAETTGRDHLRFTIRYLPERQAMAYAARRPRGLDLALSIVAAGLAVDSSAAVDSVVQSRGIILDELAARARDAASGDPELAPLNASVTAARERFANLMLRSFEGEGSVPRALLDGARQQKEEADRALAERSVAARTESARARIGLQDIRRALPADTALVSFVRYDRTSFTTNQARVIAHVVSSYIAFVISPAAEAIAVPLGSAASVESSVNAWRQEVDGRSIAAGIAAPEAERTYRTAGVRLRQRIWDPLVDHLRGASHVFIVPDGALNLVSFAALPTNGNRYLAESGPVIHLLSTERDLIPTDTAPSGHGLLVVGGPSYDRQAAGPVRAFARRTGCGSLGPLRFEDLPGSRAEVRDIARIWSPARLGVASDGAPTEDVTVLSGQAASKNAVIRASVGRQVVHLSTHGFFLGSPCESGPGRTRGVGGLAATPDSVVADNPLLLAGLAFAGANNRTSIRAGQDDGILTAEEVAALHLQGTEWAVLSACDTGLGEIRAGEGVFGLRRAFQIAGVRTIIMSLWSVEDQSTRAWMRALYEGRFQQHLSTADAVHSADVHTLQTRRARGQSTHPFYWAAFVAAGDWR